VVIGVDPGWKRLGLAVCTLEHGDPIWCGAADIDEDGGGWKHQQIGRAIGDALSTAGRALRGHTLEPSILAIEDPTFAARGKKQAAQWGEVMATVESEARRRWPHLETGGQWRLPIGTWKQRVGEAGNCGAEDYVRRAFMLGFVLPTCPHGVKAAVDGLTVGDGLWLVKPDHDAAAAACIAVAAYRINAEMFEAGE
jgi:hypothetical protein